MPMTEDAFDDLIDDATHAVNDLIPDEVLATLSADQRSDLLVRINDAMTPILREVVFVEDEEHECQHEFAEDDEHILVCRYCGVEGPA